MVESLPLPDDGCACTPHSQDAGGGYVEYLLEYEPACPEHSTHLWDPLLGTWVEREVLMRDFGGEGALVALNACLRAITRQEEPADHRYAPVRIAIRTVIEAIEASRSKENTDGQL